MADDEVERWPAWWARLYATVARDPVSNRLVVEAASPGPGDRVLDVGCGAGAAVRRAAAGGAQALGVDPSPAMVEHARRSHADHPGARFEVGDAANLPLADDAVSSAWAIATFHHWPDRRAGLREVRRVLEPGGRLWLAEKRLGRLGSHGLDAEELDATVELLGEVGFRHVRVTTARVRWSRMALVGATA